MVYVPAAHTVRTAQCVAHMAYKFCVVELAITSMNHCMHHCAACDVWTPLVKRAKYAPRSEDRVT